MEHVEVFVMADDKVSIARDSAIYELIIIFIVQQLKPVVFGNEADVAQWYQALLGSRQLRLSHLRTKHPIYIVVCPALFIPGPISGPYCPISKVLSDSIFELQEFFVTQLVRKNVENLQLYVGQGLFEGGHYDDN